MAEEKKIEAEVVEASEEKVTAKKAVKKTTKKTTKKTAKAEEKTEERVFRPAIIKDFSIIKYIIVTEATQKLQAEENAMVFAVDKKANKLEIKAAVQAIFNAKVKSVNTRNIAGKTKRVGRYTGKLPSYKKAIVRFDSSFDLGKIANQVATEEMAANEEAK